MGFEESCGTIQHRSPLSWAPVGRDIAILPRAMFQGSLIQDQKMHRKAVFGPC